MKKCVCIKFVFFAYISYIYQMHRNIRFATEFRFYVLDVPKNVIFIVFSCCSYSYLSYKSLKESVIFTVIHKINGSRTLVIHVFFKWTSI